VRAAAIGIALAVICVVATGIVIVRFWNDLGASDITLTGWLAMIFGVLVTLGLGVGLMALMFVSNRRGYDHRGVDADHDCRRF
jgi:hypothetical protein